MSWTYSGNPSASPLDEVRFLIGDTDTDKQLISDEEIAYNLTLVSGVNPPDSGNYLSAAYCADGIAARSARSVDKSIGDLSLSYSQQASAFRDLADKLRLRATLSMVPIYAGGLSEAEKHANYLDPDLVQAGIKIDGMTKPGYSNQQNDETQGP